MDGNDEGIHGLLVRIREQDHSVSYGVQIQDMGHKIGFFFFFSFFFFFFFFFLFFFFFFFFFFFSFLFLDLQDSEIFPLISFCE